MRKIPSLMPIILVSIIMLLIFTAAADAQPMGAAGIKDSFVNRTSGWWGVMQNAARQLFIITATLEVVLFGIRMVIQRSQIETIGGEFVMVLVYMTFIWMVIENYQSWAKIIGIDGLQSFAAKLGDGTPFDVGKPSELIFKIYDGIAPVMKGAGYSDIGMVMLYVVCMAAIIAVFALICLQYILIVCEFHICANVGLILIGLGGSKLFKEYAVNVMKYILSVGIKLFVLTLILNIGFSILQLNDLAIKAGATTTLKGVKILDLVLLIFQGVILVGLAKTLPDTCAGLLSGASIGGGNPLQAMGKAVGSAALGAATGGAGMALKGVANVATNAGRAFSAAGADGTKGLARIKQAAKDFGGAAVGSIGASLRNIGHSDKPSSMSNQLRSLHSARKSGMNKNTNGDGI